MCSDADYQRHPIPPCVFSFYFSFIHMQVHGSSAPNKGISWQQTEGKLLNPCAKLLSDINTFPDCVKNEALFGSASVSITQVLFIRNSLLWTQCQSTCHSYSLLHAHTKTFIQASKQAFYLCQFSINLQCWLVYQNWNWARPSVYLMSLIITLNAPVNFASG